MLHFPYRHCHGWLNSLSQPLQLCHFVIIVKIFVAIRLGFHLCQFNICKFDYGWVWSCVIRHCLCFLFQPTTQMLGLSWMVDFPCRLCHWCSVTDYQIHGHSHFIAHRSYTSLPLKLLLALYIFLPVSFCFSIGCVVLAYVGRPKQDRQCTYSLALRCIRTITVAVEKQYVLHILSAWM